MKLFGVGFLSLLVAPMFAMIMVSQATWSAAQLVILSPEPTDEALEDIPPLFMNAYFDAGLVCPGIPWNVIAGIAKVGNDHGRAAEFTFSPPVPDFREALNIERADITDHPDSGFLNHADDGILAPEEIRTISRTLATFVCDGVPEGNELEDVDTETELEEPDPADLPADPDTAEHDHSVEDNPGLGMEATHLRTALERYNPDPVWADEVLSWAGRYAIVFGLFAGADPLALIEHPNVAMGPNQEADLAAGLIDPQIVSILLWLAQDNQLYISSLVTGHSVCIGGGSPATRPGCRVSRHASGRAADIWLFGPPNPGGGVDPCCEWRVDNNNSHALNFFNTAWRQMNRTSQWQRPWTIGHPWGGLTCSGCFNNGDHEDHFHIGVLGVADARAPDIPETNPIGSLPVDPPLVTP